MAQRQRIWIDRNVQGILLERIVIYWVASLILLGGTVLCDQWWRNPDGNFGQHASEFFGQVWPWLPSVFLLMPLVLFDVVRLSHQFVGPIYRLRNHLHNLQDDIDTDPVSFRDSDYWQDVVGPINWLQAQLQEREEKIKALQFILSSQQTESEAASTQGADDAYTEVVNEPAATV